MDHEGKINRFGGRLKFRLSRVTPLLLLIFSGAEAFAEDSIALPRIEEFGFSTSRLILPDGRTALDYQDDRTGEHTRFTYDAALDSSRVELTDRDGALLSIMTRSPQHQCLEKFAPRHSKKTVRANSDGSFELEEWTEEGTVRSHISALGFADTGSCWRPDPVGLETVTRWAQGATLILVPLGTGGPNAASLGFNVVAKNCQSYPNTGVSSESTLAHEMTAAFQVGFDCLVNQLPKKYPNAPQLGQIRRDMAQVMGFFDQRNPGVSAHPFTLTCDYPPVTTTDAAGHSHIVEGTGTEGSLFLKNHMMNANARAVLCSNAGRGGDYPGVLLNVTLMSQTSARERAATLFHELLHHIPYEHFDGPDASQRLDFVYMAEICCFNGGLKSDTAHAGQSRACELISRLPHGSHY